MFYWNPKICVTPRRHFDSYIFKIIHNYRNHHGPTHRILKAYKTIRSSEIQNLSVRKKFWLELEIDLLRFKMTNVITAAEADRIRQKFGTVIAPLAAATPSPAPTVPTTSRAELLKKFPILSR